MSTPEASAPWKHTMAVQSAAAVSTFLFYPLDTVKIRMMAQNGTANRAYHAKSNDFMSVRQALMETYRFEGLSVLYRGCALAMLGSTFSWGVYMYTYQTLQSFAVDKIGLHNALVLPYFSSLSASFFTALVSNPIWLVKVRMQLQERTQTAPRAMDIHGGIHRSGNEQAYYRGFRHGVRVILSSEGPLGLVRGLSAQLLMTVPNALYLPLYEMMKRYVLHWKDISHTRTSTGVAMPQTQLASFEIAACTVTAKVFVAVISNPILVIKTKVQDHRAVANMTHLKNVSLWHTLKATIKTEGAFRGLILRGLSANVLQTTPRAVVHILMYESLIGHL